MSSEWRDNLTNRIREICSSRWLPPREKGLKYGISCKIREIWKPYITHRDRISVRWITVNWQHTSVTTGSQWQASQENDCCCCCCKSQSANTSRVSILLMQKCTFGLVWVEFNAPPDTIEVISEVVFRANHLTDTGKQKCTGKYKQTQYKSEK